MIVPCTRSGREGRCAEQDNDATPRHLGSRACQPEVISGTSTIAAAIEPGSSYRGCLAASTDRAISRSSGVHTDADPWTRTHHSSSQFSE